MLRSAKPTDIPTSSPKMSEDSSDVALIVQDSQSLVQHDKNEEQKPVANGAAKARPSHAAPPTKILFLDGRITKALEEQEKKGSGGVATCLGGWTNPVQVLANLLAWAQEAKSSGALKSVVHKIRSSSMSLAKTKPHESIA
ncbi:hypothetical protein PC129_g9062 [Phytophthora cactorum]|uniref:Uncharacterized protein n=1 Tax=Phytophthora cactorum TaxID=29920 RepID=A0A8T1D2E3_9STRA|nr:hypothetical protein PC115_g5865 [Phytophthora cactorum]KAG2948070.1 hypothetical protein PC117_g6310 [Phytophthora cactorum]KAG3220163.1 hypothetical protein PC129_g9062 [Phytophthora cactorum]